MGLSQLDNTIVKGALGLFSEKMEAAKNLWRPYAQIVKSTSSKETHAFVGHVPEPVVLMGERRVQNMIDYSFDITNETREVTIAVPREDFEDQQVDKITTKFGEIGEVFAAHKDKLFAELLAANAAPPIADDTNVTWATWFELSAAGIIGASANTNDRTTNIAAPASPTTAEWLASFKAMVLLLRDMQDDVGRVGYNAPAMSSLRILVPAEYEYAAKEMVGKTLAGGGDTNILKGVAEVDVLDYLTSAANWYLGACGATRKPLLVQERAGLEVIIDTDPKRVAERNAVLVLCRERFAMKPGDPRRMCREIFT